MFTSFLFGSEQAWLGYVDLCLVMLAIVVNLGARQVKGARESNCTQWPQ